MDQEMELKTGNFLKVLNIAKFKCVFRIYDDIAKGVYQFMTLWLQRSAETNDLFFPFF